MNRLISRQRIAVAIVAAFPFVGCGGSAESEPVDVQAVADCLEGDFESVTTSRTEVDEIAAEAGVGAIEARTGGNTVTIAVESTEDDAEAVEDQYGAFADAFGQGEIERKGTAVVAWSSTPREEEASFVIRCLSDEPDASTTSNETSTTATETSTTSTQAVSPEDSLEKAAATWAGLYGANEAAACDYMDDSICDIYIDPGKDTTGTYQVTFIAATVDCLEVDTSSSLPEGTVKYTNGETTEWRLYGEDEWEIVNFGGNTGKGFECP